MSTPRGFGPKTGYHTWDLLLNKAHTNEVPSQSLTGKSGRLTSKGQVPIVEVIDLGAQFIKRIMSCTPSHN